MNKKTYGEEVVAASDRVNDLMLKTYATVRQLEEELAEEIARLRGDPIQLTEKPGVSLAKEILKGIEPNKSLGIKHQGKWPNWAVCAVEYETHHRDFGNKPSGKRTVFFESEEDRKAWLLEEHQAIADRDWCYSMRGDLYKWDLGPEREAPFSLG